MGICLYYTARAAGPAGIERALDAMVDAAARRGWQSTRFANDHATLSREIDDQQSEYSGPTTGVEVIVHEMCDPWRLEFDRDGLAQDFVKTQFAGADIHVEIVAALREIEPRLASLTVFDDGEYWASGDRARLTAHIESLDASLAEHLRSDAELMGPVKLPDGRILDLIKVPGEARSEARSESKPWWRFW